MQLHSLVLYPYLIALSVLGFAGLGNRSFLGEHPLLLVPYLIVLTILGIYGGHRILMLFHFRWRASPPQPRSDLLPRVTVQLPIYNERTVAERLLESAGALDYPRERLEIQVLDDSTDETREIVDRVAARLVARGLDVRVLRRPDRKGYKAGALDTGLQQSRGELVCIFDADFTPGPDFIAELVGHFADPQVGMVQARWGHKNRGDSALTRAQSTLLDGHFVIEHKVRHDRGLFFNFNGTAGIWRKTAIQDAGGWQHDTLTEDLDLSYRAQLRGWKFVYAPDVVAAAEVPPDIAAFKSQQHRWARGSVQVAKKLLREILTSKQPLRIKLEAIAHLTGNTGYPFVLLLACLLPLVVGLETNVPQFAHVLLFLVCTLSVFLFYEASQRAVGRGILERSFDTLAAVVLGIGMSLSQSGAVVAGLFGRTGTFVRTPKRGDGAAARVYRAVWKGLPGAELVLAAWFGWGSLNAVEEGLWGALPFLLLFLTGFLWVGALSLAQWAREVRAQT